MPPVLARRVPRFARSESRLTASVANDPIAPGGQSKVRSVRISIGSAASASINQSQWRTYMKNQQWRDAGVTKRLADRFIAGKEYYDHRDETQNRRYIESSFFVTANTNRVIKEFDAKYDAGQEACRYAMTMMATDDVIRQYIKFGPAHPFVYGDDRYEDVVSSVEVTGRPEVGDKAHRLHVHMTVVIRHFSQIHIDRFHFGAQFKKHFNESFGGGNDYGLRMSGDLYATPKVYVQVKLLPSSDWSQVLQRYIHKGMLAGENMTAEDMKNLESVIS